MWTCFGCNGPTFIYKDNATTILIVNSAVSTELAQHFYVHYFTIQDWKEWGCIKLIHISGILNPSNTLTKPLDITYFHHLFSVLSFCMVMYIHSDDEYFTSMECVIVQTQIIPLMRIHSKVTPEMIPLNTISTKLHNLNHGRLLMSFLPLPLKQLSIQHMLPFCYHKAEILLLQYIDWKVDTLPCRHTMSAICFSLDNFKYPHHYCY